MKRVGSIAVALSLLVAPNADARAVTHREAIRTANSVGRWYVRNDFSRSYRVLRCAGLLTGDGFDCVIRERGARFLVNLERFTFTRRTYTAHYMIVRRHGHIGVINLVYCGSLRPC